MRRTSVPLLVTLLLFLAGCAGPTDEPAAQPSPSPSTATTTPSVDAPATTVPADATADLLALPASGTSTARSCAPEDISLALTPIEPALGHRFTRVALRNDSDSTCVVRGFPGIGGRGESGAPLDLLAAQRQRTGEDTRVHRVTLGPAGEAYANLEWTGDLAGAETERLTVLVLQLARGQEPVAATTTESLDIGNGTTVRIGPWEAGPAVRAAPACKVGPRRTPSGVKRFWTKDKRCSTSPWFAGAHRTMIPYGCTRAPWYPASSRCAGGRGFHHGLDLDMPKGTRVYAGVSGRVVTRGLGSAYGNRAVILRSRGRDILLGHLRSRAVKHGERVRKGDLIGRSGARGAPDGPHLHLEVRPARGSYRDAVNPRRVARLTAAR
ncbi:peptidoglycan DD-metalloendopeptidase family protein [Mumia sp. ZJ430]|uniref:peptidoglycan DD-metalloendopeptidase family protein n=1 Tax=Mumia sp. ZJ430 TaxID=2708083 RepID=UPI001420DA33|nr:peptidoglycan DD-metalloendopeptidase family protein [Mumia sp. ZJ430]